MFQLEDTQLRAADRLDRWLLIMVLVLYWCVRVGQQDTLDHPAPLEKIHAQTDTAHWTLRNSPIAPFPDLRAVRVPESRLPMELPLPPSSPSVL